jgi:3-oxoacyl-[acyl-carrier protein] reductase
MSYIIVTGGSKNIGKEVSLLLAKSGCDVAIHYKDGIDQADALQKEIRSLGVNCEIVFGDFSSEEGLEAFVSLAKAKLKSIKGLVNNAGFYKVGALQETSFHELKHIFQVNLFSAFYLIQSFVKELIIEEGSIVNLGMCGLISKMADDYATAFQMSKLSLLMLTKSFAKSLAKDKIKVNMVSPGYTETSIDLPKNYDSLPMKRAAANIEIAEGVLFFLNHPYITGQNLEIAGGVRL